MAGKILTQKRIEAMKLGEELADAGDNEGLRVSRSRRGTRFWYRRSVTVDGKKMKKAHLIGWVPEISLADARAALAEMKSQSRMGINPTMPESDAELQPYTVRELVDDYIAHLKGKRQEKGRAEVNRVLTKLLVDPLGDRQVEDIGEDDVLDIARYQLEKGNNAQAGVFARECRAAWNHARFYSKRLKSKFNPGQLALDELKNSGQRITSKRRQRYLTDSELKKLLAWLPQSGFSRPQKVALELVLRTGCRSGEAVSARWSDIDLDTGVWNQPALNENDEQMKGVGRELLMAPSTTAWLRTIRAEHPEGDYVCPSSVTGLPIKQKSLTHETWVMRKAGTMVDIAPWTPHDLRRSVRTGLSKLGCPREVAEAVLNHAAPGLVGVYEVFEYYHEIGEWLTKWNAHLDTLRPKPQLRAVV